MSEYHRMSIAEKQAYARGVAREPAVACPVCETQTSAADLLQHASRCPGRREPHPGSRWITWAEAKALGCLSGTLTRWVRAGKVRARGVVQDRVYLLRDLAPLLARRLSSGSSDRKIARGTVGV